MKVFVRSLVILSSLSIGMLVPFGIAGAHSPVPATPDTPVQTTPIRPESFVQLVGEALNHVKLQPQQQQAVEALAEPVQRSEMAVDQAKKALTRAIADQVETGRVDRTALLSKIAEFVKASDEASPVLRGSLEKLHEILDPAQRAEFIGALERGMSARSAARNSANWLDRWSADLGLNDEQRQELRAAFDRLGGADEQARQRFRRVLDAFKGESFSFETLATERDVPVHALQKAERMVAMAQAATTILNPDQRARLATKIREMTEPAPEPPKIHLESAQHPEETSASGESVGTSQDALWGYGGGVGYGGSSVGYAAGSSVSYSTGFGGGYASGGMSGLIL
jgi:Spy/CpxP family protein refolding chaperone